MSDSLAIETHALTKQFRDHAAVDSVDLSVPRGAVFGFLGPNGSGKTTTIRMLLGLASSTSGEARVLGRVMPKENAAVLPRVGALVEGPGFYPFLSGTANLHRLDTADRHADSASRSERVERALDRVGLTAAAGKKVKNYSLGMKQRLGIANALLMPRDLLVLDEPTNGLDPQGTREVRALVASLTSEGATVFVSSHLLAEIEQMCTHAAIMSAGRLVASGTLDALRQHGRALVRVETPDVAAAVQTLRRLGLTVVDPAGDGTTSSGPVSAAMSGTVTATFDTAGEHGTAGELDTADTADNSGHGIAPEAIVAALVTADVRVRAFSVQQPSLEDRFVELTGEGFDVDR